MGERAAANFVRRRHYCVLGIVSADGDACVSRVVVNYDRDVHLYFEFALDSRHSKQIAPARLFDRLQIA
jgi:hypothetical protein